MPQGPWKCARPPTQKKAQSAKRQRFWPTQELTRPAPTRMQGPPSCNRRRPAHSQAEVWRRVGPANAERHKRASRACSLVLAPGSKHKSARASMLVPRWRRTAPAAESRAAPIARTQRPVLRNSAGGATIVFPKSDHPDDPRADEHNGDSGVVRRRDASGRFYSRKTQVPLLPCLRHRGPSRVGFSSIVSSCEQR